MLGSQEHGIKGAVFCPRFLFTGPRFCTDNTLWVHSWNLLLWSAPSIQLLMSPGRVFSLGTMRLMQINVVEGPCLKQAADSSGAFPSYPKLYLLFSHYALHRVRPQSLSACGLQRAAEVFWSGMEVVRGWGTAHDGWELDGFGTALTHQKQEQVLVLPLVPHLLCWATDLFPNTHIM